MKLYNMSKIPCRCSCKVDLTTNKLINVTTISDHVGNDVEAIPDATSGEPDDRKVIAWSRFEGAS